MKLYSRVFGEGQPLLIIHGLFGMSDNWQSLAKLYADYFEVHLIDQRNHGRSPHSEGFSYQHLSHDLYQYITDKQLGNPIVIGHSLGGKTAMQFAVSYPEQLAKLIVVDISPRYYPIHHDKIIDGLKALDFSTLKSRSQADAVLSEYIEEGDVRQFLLKSMYWRERGKLDFRFNLNVISKNIANVGEALDENAICSTPTLFVKGDHSNYIQDEDEDLIFKHFTDAEIETIPETGHWLHAESPEAFFEMTIRFCL
ncbi:alpha/beta fold hydrolase [Flavobacteriales bacterium]|nr:alpha/beta fold hydrolase [Flavobacteriales bacterium]